MDVSVLDESLPAAFERVAVLRTFTMAHDADDEEPDCRVTFDARIYDCWTRYRVTRIGACTNCWP